MVPEIVCATRHEPEAFWAGSALGLSLKRLPPPATLVTRIAFANRRGLPAVYNEAIRAGGEDAPLVFVHDDVWIDDIHFWQRLAEGLAAFDVIGVVGNRRRVPMQPAWPFLDLHWKWDERENLSGAIACGKSPFGAVMAYGRAPAECELLDGVMLATTRGRLVSAGCFFDERFEFDFYDLDFCRAARAKGLRLGTWPVSLTHQSEGGYGSDAWKRAYVRYFSKWPD
jgi:hypothetical protein